MVKLLSENKKGLTLGLDDLHNLEDIGIAGTDLARRDLDEEHVYQLVLSDSDDWPEVLVTKTDRGYALMDGYHRREAARKKGMKELRAESRAYESENDVIEATFEANIKHGLKLSEENRSNYAYWLHITYPDMTQKDIADRCKIKQATVSRALARRAKPKVAPGAKSDEEKRREHARRTASRLTHDAVTLFSDINEMSESEQRAAILESLGSVEDRDKILKIAQLIEELLQPAKRRPRPAGRT